MAQLVARLVRNEKVRGSNPLSSTKLERDPRDLVGPVNLTLPPRRTAGGVGRARPLERTARRLLSAGVTSARSAGELFGGLLALGLARRVVLPRTAPTVRVYRVSERTVTLAADPKTTHEGDFGLWLDETGAHVRVGRVLKVDQSARTVEREVLAISGELGAAAEGRWTGHVFAGPADIDPAYRDVDIAVDGGAAPAWLFDSAQSREGAWSIHIHGIRTTRVTALRTVPAARAAGHTVLVPSFRGDGEGPPTARGVSTLGQTEWRDVDAAVAFAVENGATSIVLVGWSMGATIALLVAERSAHRHLISRLVLVAPATDWRGVIRNGVARAKLPPFAARFTEYALQSGAVRRLVGLREPVHLDALDWISGPRVSVPCLVIHSSGDTEVPFELTKRFQLANPQKVDIVEFPAAAHAWEYNRDAARFTRVVTEWLTR